MKCVNPYVKIPGRLHIDEELFLVDDPQYLRYLNSNSKGERAGLHGVDMIHSEREVGGVMRRENRYYLCSVESVEEFQHSAKGHWSIENSLHWVLDVAFREDHNRARIDHSALS